jgi:protease-4
MECAQHGDPAGARRQRGRKETLVMKWPLGAAVQLAVAVVLIVSASASAEVLGDTWLRGASSVAVNDDATAIFLNPACLGMYGDSGGYFSLSMSGSDVSGVSAASKMGPLGIGYTRNYMWSGGLEALGSDGSGLTPSDDAVDTYYLGLALGEPRSFSVGFDYRWFRPQFGERDKTGTWDVGAVYRPTSFLSIGAAARNLNEPSVFGDEESARAGCACGTRTTYVGGVALRPRGSRITLMADASMEREQDLEDAIFTGGLEAEIVDGVVLRGSMQSYPDGEDRESEFSAGLWFNTTHLGVGGYYTSMDEAENDIMTYGLSTSDERQRTVFRSSGKIAEIEVGGPLSDFRPGWSLFGEPHHSAQRVIRDIRRAARDKSVDCILLNIKPLEGPFLGGPSALVQEIRDEVVRARDEHGIRTVAYLEYGGGTQEYFLATACDRIMIHPSTGIDGLGSYVTVSRFTKSTEKLGIEWDYLSAGKYKSTFHSLGGPPLTDDQREEVQGLEDAIYEELIAAVMEGRDMTRDDAERACDGRLFIPDKLIEMGLVDNTGTYDDAKAEALALAGGDVPDRPEDREDISTIDVGSWHARDYDWGAQPVVAVVGAYGGISEGEGGTDPIRGRQSIGSESLVKSLRAARKNSRVKAVVLRIDSGGGSGLASDIIWYETVKVAKKKPLIVSMGNMAASGGYYIAIQGEKIFVEPLTITGSIGVVGMMPVIEQLYDKIDASHETFKRGAHSDQFSPMRRLTDEEMAMAEDAINWFYDDFVEKAADARGMDESRLRELAQGRVYMGSQALQNGLVDERGGLSDAIDYACGRIGVKRDDAKVVYYREGHSLFDRIMSGAVTKLGLWKLLDFGDAGMQDLLRMEAFTDLPVE